MIRNLLKLEILNSIIENYTTNDNVVQFTKVTFQLISRLVR